MTGGLRTQSFLHSPYRGGVDELEGSENFRGCGHDYAKLSFNLRRFRDEMLAIERDQIVRLGLCCGGDDGRVLWVDDQCGVIHESPGWLDQTLDRCTAQFEEARKAHRCLVDEIALDLYQDERGIKQLDVSSEASIDQG